MPSRRLDQTPVDYLVIALAPGLIMGLVGSLAFFLLEVFYRGGHGGRLSWILFFFVLAAVLIARISISEGSAHAGVYGAVLAMVTAVAMIRLVDRPLVGCLLLAVIWWCAHKLTWDCTLIDEQEEDSGQGVLESAGLDYEAKSRDEELLQDDRETLEVALKTTRRSWWRQLAIGLVEPDRRPHPPGVWVIYFSLAALPLFGLGQLLIPVADAARRNYAFAMLCVYLACGLALLAVTSFLGLRRYLRQRRLEMPGPMVGAWMGASVALIALLLIVAAVLPSPGDTAQWKLPEMFSLSSPQREASSVAVLREDGVEGEGAASDMTDREAESASDKPGENATPGDGPPGDNPQGDPQGDGGNQQDSQSSDNANQSQSTQNNDSSDGEPANDKPSEQSSGGSGEPRQGRQGQSGTEPPPSASQPQPPPAGNRISLPRISGAWVQWLKWLLYAVLAAVGLYMCVRHWDQVRGWFADLINELRGIFRGLFGRRGKQPSEEPAAEPRPAHPFALFSDPFEDGTAAERSPDELVRYSFAAMEAWAAEFAGGRRPEWTPAELAHHLAGEHAHLAEAAPPLASLYARLAYAGQSLSPECLGTLRKFWQALGERKVAREVV